MEKNYGLLLLGLFTVGIIGYRLMVSRMMNLCPHFTLSELTVTDTGAENVPGPVEIANLQWLCGNVLEPLRSQIGRMQITSGYRSAGVSNALISQGYEVSSSSQHNHGQAVDFIPLDVSHGVAWGAILEGIASGLPIDQAGNYGDGHIHLSSVGASGNRGEVYYEDV